MSRAYEIFLALFILGLVSTVINAILILPANLPSQDVDFNESTITEITGGVQSSETNINLFFGSIMLLKMLGFFLSAITTVFYIIPLLSSYNITGEIAWLLQSLIWFMEFVFIAQFVTGRSLRDME